MVPHSLLLPGALHLIYFGLILPYRTWRYRNVWPKADEPRRSRVEYYQAHASHFLSRGFLSLMTLFTLWRAASRVPAASDIFVFGRVVPRPADVWPGLLWPASPAPSTLLLGVVACAVIVAIDLAYSRRCFDLGAPHMYAATPQTRQERWAWVGHSSLAGVTEELTWRAVQPEMIAQLTGHLWWAIVICAVTFGFGHIRQGRPFVLIATLFALIFHALAWWSGGLLIPMTVHVAVNVIVGLRAGMWVRAA